MNVIHTRDSIASANVVSRGFQGEYHQLKGCLKDFIKEVREQGMRPAGHLFYSIDINQITPEGVTAVEVFLPVDTLTTLPQSDDRFHSYFIMTDMISTCILKDFEAQTEGVYANMFRFAAANGLELVPPFFNEYHTNKGEGYIIVKSCVRKSKEKMDKAHPRPSGERR